MKKQTQIDGKISKSLGLCLHTYYLTANYASNIPTYMITGANRVIGVCAYRYESFYITCLAFRWTFFVFGPFINATANHLRLVVLKFTPTIRFAQKAYLVVVGLVRDKAATEEEVAAEQPGRNIRIIHADLTDYGSPKGCSFVLCCLVLSIFLYSLLAEWSAFLRP